MSFSLANIDRRVFYWILFIALMVPFLNPIGFPIKIAKTPETSMRESRATR